MKQPPMFKSVVNRGFQRAEKRTLTILIIHNRYLLPGGEDEVVHAEKRMLEKFGNQVVLYERSNSEINDLTLLNKLVFLLKDIYWSKPSYQAIRKLIDEEKPDIAHFHNTFFLISPSAYDACYDAKIPIVQTVHNYRFLCPIGTFYRKGQICEDCLQNGKISSVINKCWKDSYFYSLVLSKILANIEKRKVVSEKIRHLITLTPFSKQKFIDNGFDRNKISLKPNFIDAKSSPCPSSRENGEYGLFVGALRDYKGIRTLVNAWQNFKIDFPLKIIGEGPLHNELEKCSDGTRIEILGAKPFDETLHFMRKSLFLVVPSECYETGSRVTIEAFACGVPVIATNHGALKDLVDHGKTGLLFERTNTRDLAQKINSLVQNPLFAKKLGKNARRKYEERYAVEENYKILMDIYTKVLEKF